MLSHKWDVHINPFQGSGSKVEREEEGRLRAGDVRGVNSVFCAWHHLCSQELIAICTSPHKLVPRNAPGAGYWQVMVARGRGVIFFSDVVAVNVPTLQAIPLNSCKQTPS